MTNALDLFSSYELQKIDLKNRIVMAPMTRCRTVNNVPNDLMAEYYTQRAQAGLIITEGTSPSPNGLGYARMPGLFNAEHVAGWKKITDAVHAAGSKIVVQIMHAGRVGHPANLPEGARLLAPSAVAWTGEMYVDGQGNQPIPVAQEMTPDDIEAAIQEYVHAAELAIEAGFDGVELHAANGYLIEQFLNTAANQRTDQWGGSVENRIRFAVEIARRTAEKIGADRVGIRVSPYSSGQGLNSDDLEIESVYGQLADELKQLGLMYIHIVDHSAMGMPTVPDRIKTIIREAFQGTIILSGNYDLGRANADLAEGRGHLVAFGRPFISNPDLPTRLREGRELTPPDFTTLYTPGSKGYTDYPTA